jgi:Cu+-exporting ATPase
MHPQIIRNGPGNCPICGMALEPMTATGAEGENPELRSMTRRFWVSVVLSVPLLLLVMADDFLGAPVSRSLSATRFVALQLLLATPVVLLGRLAVLRARLAVDRQSQPEHVHAHRHRHRRCLWL